MVAIGRNVFLVLAVVLAAGLFIQVFLAGLGVFAGPTNFAIHRDTGYTLSVLPLFMIIAALVGRLGRRMAFASLAVGLLFVLQSVLVAMRTSSPAIAALHPVNGFIILLLALWILREAWRSRGTRQAEAAAA